jgi:hypothetical protein
MKKRNKGKKKSKMVRFIKNNKQVMAIAVFIITIISIALTLVIAKHLFFKINDAFVEGDLGTPESNQVFDDMAVSFPIFDGAMAFVLIGLTIGLVITSFFIKTHPIFMVINIVGLIFLVFIAAVLGNFFNEVVTNTEINETISRGGELSSTKFIMDKLPWICAIVVFLSTVVMYSKGGGE